jgi:hypothetical protein
MDREEIIKLTQEAGLYLATDVHWMPIIGLEYAEKFAALVAAAECERNDAYIKSLHESVSWQAERVIACLKALEKAVLAEREACAKVCEEVGERRQHLMHKHTSSECAAAIRARGQE